ncbi:MAG: hypothetical protein V4773_07625 [Verrucomicrobiota bacterium]
MTRAFTYLAVVLVFGLGIFFTLQAGRDLPAPATVAKADTRTAALGTVAAAQPSTSLFANIESHLEEPLPRLLVQLIVIVAMARDSSG